MQCKANTFIMDIVKIFISFVLVIVFYLMFGHESVKKLNHKGMTISHFEDDNPNLKSPGNVKALYGIF